MIRFLIDEDLPRSTFNFVRQYGHEAVDVRDSGVRGASDADVAVYAQNNSLCLLTADLGFADIRNYPPGEYFGIVVLRLPVKATSAVILDLLRGLLEQPEIVGQLKGNLAIVGSGRIRIRKG